MQIPLLRLQCGVNSYEWGKKGYDSAAARFAAATGSSELSIQSDKPYSELWMGTHPSNPSTDLDTGRTLADLFSDNELLLSHAVSEKFGKKLPFLFKVLSINKALSIQAHPNKRLAQLLHDKDPQNYPDNNHKPEMVIAITPFEGLCGFRPPTEVAHFLETISPLRRLVGEDNCRQFVKAAKERSEGAEEKNMKRALQQAFKGLMSSSAEDISCEVPKLLELATSAGPAFAGSGVASTTGEVLAELVTRLYSQFGQDIGLFVLFFLNFVTLNPGEALFLVADDIHAYISGDVMECMAASDNVVRAGLTPKFKDVPTLIDMLTYNFAPIGEQKMVPTEYPYVTLNRKAYSSGSIVWLYDPPIEEFSIVRTVLRGDGAKATFEALNGPSILICTSGKGIISIGPTRREMAEGYIFFVGSTAECVLESAVGPDEDFIIFKAFCELEIQPLESRKQ